MFNFKDNFQIQGHLQISKLYVTGEEEIVFDDHNIIVSGMGVNLAYMFTGSGSTSLADYQVRYFQVGTSGGVSLEVSTTFDLSGPLANTDYGADSILAVDVHDHWKNGLIVADQAFLKIPFSQITRLTDTSVRWALLLDENTANDQNLTEVGLFASNPTGAATEASILIAYRSHTSIPKSSDFALIYRWTILF